ncbi:MAG: hypothetical protein EXS05_06185 [Planctomycetaceae bacterium]|nr:hypothetical protein [Planctomycetaceae bacterium]
MLENVPPDEPRQIEHIVELTRQQLQSRYPGDRPVLRGVHAKGHGCVTATFTVEHCLAENLRRGVFAQPGKQYSALVRYSNAAPLVTPDSTPGANGAAPAHGSRGMAIKVLGVEGPSLGPVQGAATQDFLMVNQPVFAFANVEDYEVLSRVLVDHNDNPLPFFPERLPPAGTVTPTLSQKRAVETREIVGRVRSASLTATPPAFQVPPTSPVDNDYFSASPFLLGPDQVMRFRVRPTTRSADEPNVSDPNYLRTALVKRLRDQQAGDVVFHFEVQVRPADSIDPDVDIENSSHAWPDTFPFEHVATLTIPLQEFDTPQQHERCERLVFTPWHGLEAHRPLGGINRLRRAVYEASAMFRHLPKEPAAVD